MATLPVKFAVRIRLVVQVGEERTCIYEAYATACAGLFDDFGSHQGLWPRDEFYERRAAKAADGAFGGRLWQPGIRGDVLMDDVAIRWHS